MPQLPRRPGVRARCHVLFVHQNGWGAQVADVLGTGRILAAPLGPYGGNLSLTTRLGQRLTGATDIRTAWIVDQLDLHAERQSRLLGGRTTTFSGQCAEQRLTHR